MARKGWEALSPAYRKRLESHGITAEAYSEGESIKSARGHRATPERRPWMRRAELNDIEAVIPDWDSLDRDTKETLGRDWVMGFMSKGKGNVKNPKRKRGERIKRGASDEQLLARRRFLRFQDEYETDYQDGAFWKAFRSLYQSSFAA